MRRCRNPCRDSPRPPRLHDRLNSSPGVSCLDHATRAVGDPERDDRVADRGLTRVVVARRDVQQAARCVERRRRPRAGARWAELAHALRIGPSPAFAASRRRGTTSKACAPSPTRARRRRCRETCSIRRSGSAADSPPTMRPARTRRRRDTSGAPVNFAASCSSGHGARVGPACGMRARKSGPPDRRTRTA